MIAENTGDLQGPAVKNGANIKYKQSQLIITDTITDYAIDNEFVKVMSRFCLLEPTITCTVKEYSKRSRNTQQIRVLTSEKEYLMT